MLAGCDTSKQLVETDFAAAKHVVLTRTHRLHALTRCSICATTCTSSRAALGRASARTPQVVGESSDCNAGTRRIHHAHAPSTIAITRSGPAAANNTKTAAHGPSAKSRLRRRPRPTARPTRRNGSRPQKQRPVDRVRRTTLPSMYADTSRLRCSRRPWRRTQQVPAKTAVVCDLGTGPYSLRRCAAAGARKVYAIEAVPGSQKQSAGRTRPARGGGQFRRRAWRDRSFVWF